MRAGFLFCLLPMVAAGIPLHAQSREQLRPPSTVVILRLGLTAASPLLRDPLASQVPFHVRDKVQGVTIRQNVAPLLGLGVRRRLGNRMEIEVEGGWTFAAMKADDGVQSWTLQDLGIGQASLSLLRPLGMATRLRAGVGTVHYSSDGKWPMEEKSATKPSLVLGIGQEVKIARLPIAIELVGQAHSFDAPAQGARGTVFRASVQGTVDVGGFR